MTTEQRGYVPNQNTMAVFVTALGRVMQTSNLSAGAALDGQDNQRLIQWMMLDGVDGVDAEKILALDHSQMTEAIDDAFHF